MHPLDRFLPKHLRPKPNPRIAAQALWDALGRLDLHAVKRAHQTLRDEGVHSPVRMPPELKGLWTPVLESLVRRPADLKAAMACLTWLRDQGLGLDARCTSTGLYWGAAIAQAPQGAELAHVWTAYPHWRYRAEAFAKGAMGPPQARAFWRAALDRQQAFEAKQALTQQLPTPPEASAPPRPRM